MISGEIKPPTFPSSARHPQSGADPRFTFTFSTFSTMSINAAAGHLICFTAVGLPVGPSMQWLNLILRPPDPPITPEISQFGSHGRERYRQHLTTDVFHNDVHENLKHFTEVGCCWISSHSLWIFFFCFPPFASICLYYLFYRIESNLTCI